MVCHTQRFYAATIEAKRRIVEGRLTPRHFHVEFEYLRRQNVNWQGRKRSWTDNLLWHHGGHVVDLAIWLFGEQPVAARAFYGPSDNPLKVPLDLTAQMRFPNGGLATYAMSYNALVPREKEQMTLICDKDRLVWDDLRLMDHRGMWSPTSRSRMPFCARSASSSNPSVRAGGRSLPAVKSSIHTSVWAIWRKARSQARVTGCPRRARNTALVFEIPSLRLADLAISRIVCVSPPKDLAPLVA